MDDLEIKCEDKIDKTKRRSSSAWKRTKLLLTCSSCHNNDSDTDPYDSDLNILEVPLCSGDKKVGQAITSAPSDIENREPSMIFSDSEENLAQVDLDLVNFREEFENSIDEWLAVSKDTGLDIFERSVSATVLARVERRSSIKAALRETESLLEKQGSEAMNDETVQVHKRSNIDDVLVSHDEVENLTKDEANNSEREDNTALVYAMDETCATCKAEERKYTSSEETGSRDEAESTNHSRESRDIFEKDIKITDGCAEASGVVADFPSNTTEAATLVKQLAVPLRYVLGTGEAHAFPDVDGADVAAGDVLESGEGQVQEFLQEVISERELIAMRVEVINNLLARECNSEEYVEASRLETLVGSLAGDLAGRDMTLPSQTVDDAAAGARSATDCKTAAHSYASVTKMNLQEANLLVSENGQCDLQRSASASVEVTDEAANLAREVGEEPAEEVSMMNVFYKELDQETAEIFQSTTSEFYKCATENWRVEVSAEVGDSAEGDTVIECEEAAPTVPLEVNFPATDSVSTTNIWLGGSPRMTECEEAAPTVPLEVNFPATDSVSTTNIWLGGSPRMTECEEAAPSAPLEATFPATHVASRTTVWQGSSPWVSQEIAQAARAVGNNFPLTPTPSLSCLTEAAEDVSPLSFEGSPLPSSDNNADALVAAMETTEWALAGLGEASLGCLRPKSSVNDLDTLLNALETTELTLANLEEASLSCLQSSSEHDRDTEEIPYENPEVIAELRLSDDEESGLRFLESVALDEDLAASPMEAETTPVNFDEAAPRFSKSIPCDRERTTSQNESMTIGDLDQMGTKFLNRLRYADKYLSVPRVVTNSEALPLEGIESPPTGKDLTNCLADAESTPVILQEAASGYRECSTTRKDLPTLVETESTTLAESAPENLECGTDKNLTTLVETESTILVESVPENLECGTDKNLTTQVETESTILAESVPENLECGTDKNLTTLVENESTILAESFPENLECGTDKNLTTLVETESTILTESAPENLESGTDKDLTTQVETESTILTESAPENLECGTDKDLTALEETESTILAEAHYGDLESLSPANDLSISLDAATSPIEGLAVDSCCSTDYETKQSTSLEPHHWELADFETDPLQPTPSSNYLEATLTPTSESRVDLAVVRETTSLIDVVKQPSLADMTPTTSLMGLATASDDSIPDVEMSPSTEETDLGATATASTSAEWPDQGKEQHRTTRSNNKRNKKRNRRNKK